MTSAEDKPLTADQIAHWENEGFLILPGFMPRDIVDAVNAEVDGLVRSSGAAYPQTTVDVLHGPLSGRRLSIVDTPADAYDGPVKINDLYMDSEVIRGCNLNRELLAVLRQLLGDDALACNSLNFIFGSQQPAHYDTWYMPPPVRGMMAVTSICLEDVTPNNGPLFYYPRSHRIEPYAFSHGGIHEGGVDASEIQACRAYVDASIEEHDLQREVFYGRAGDVFIWHSQLLHGGSVIADPRATRRSLVTHHWRRGDVGPDRVGAHGEGRYVLLKERLGGAAPAPAES